MRKRFHHLKKIRIRQDWSRWTLYNLSRLTQPNIENKTFFQQKWAAKSLTRAYHGEQVREKQWQRMFRRNLPGVVPMDHQYLARNDGSEQAAGRGSGADSKQRPRHLPPTPYMQMTFYPIERRLDTAIWRALFASSAKQARQFVVHGWVKVNGKKMIYPGYLLNPGDMFQVEPDRVMYATGARKDTTKHTRRRARKRASKPKEPKAPKLTPATKAPAITDSLKASPSVHTPTPTPPSPEELKERLMELMDETKAALETDKGIGAKDKQKLRDFKKAVRRAISAFRGETPDSFKSLEDQLAFIKARYSAAPSSSASDSPTALLDPDQEKLLTEAFNRIRDDTLSASDANPVDPKKPYATPWRPRDYMSAFAFIPRYLEVNQNVCAAVYLRHPVARPGLGEVPTPFAAETSQLAFNWYLKRR
ncbi:alpha-L RNA-binding motif-containing protein [Lepidopterella palustris CBS 459.81]|uniref:Alpha-L RNA-binding motif-containing protein n=1 Tax=Lepidopterella palustris CBS 459.81 TaxID=1314670 RepID=A0A8E2EHP7_9PEZI|nr:alpha-L RNA-binding motif-containing protein [Lepidopterella palustris CBS 459.81]